MHFRLDPFLLPSGQYRPSFVLERAREGSRFSFRGPESEARCRSQPRGESQRDVSRINGPEVMDSRNHVLQLVRDKPTAAHIPSRLTFYAVMFVSHLFRSSCPPSSKRLAKASSMKLPRMVSPRHRTSLASSSSFPGLGCPIISTCVGLSAGQQL